MMPESASKAPSSPLETTAGSEQRPDHTGVIRPADDPLTTEANKWLQMCGSCDAGLTMNCTCPEGDYRSLIHRLDMARVALTAEVERLTYDRNHPYGDVGPDTHRLIHVEVCGSFIQAVCRCGTQLFDTGITSYSAMLAKHIQEANTPHNDPEFGFDKTAALSDPGWADPCPESCAGQSWTGVDQAEGPDKVWRCDTCGRIVSQNVSNPS